MKRFFARAHNVLAHIVLLSVALEFYLAGVGVFAAGSLDPHRMLGAVIVLGGLLLTLTGLAGGRRTAVASLEFLLLTVLQVVLIVLGDVSRYIAALHPLNALAVLFLSRELARGRYRAEVPAEADQPGKAQVYPV